MNLDAELWWKVFKWWKSLGYTEDYAIAKANKKLGLEV